MTEQDANELSDCGYGCYIIGGPWITTNPECPECNNDDYCHDHDCPKHCCDCWEFDEETS